MADVDWFYFTVLVDRSAFALRKGMRDCAHVSHGMCGDSGFGAAFLDDFLQGSGEQGPGPVRRIGRNGFMEKKGIQVIDADKFFGKTQALRKVNMECGQGEIVGIIGRNGAGKTVLFKAICGLLTLDAGEILVNGVKRQADILPSAGIIIEEPAFLKNCSGVQNLEYLYMINHKADRPYLESILEKVGLDAKSKKHVGKYSMGMRQRLAVAQAIMENPDFLILDEPFNGLDNQGVREMRELFLDMKQVGKVMLLASHNPEDIRILCDRVYSMEAGRLTGV